MQPRPVTAAPTNPSTTRFSGFSGFSVETFEVKNGVVTANGQFNAATATVVVDAQGARLHSVYGAAITNRDLTAGELGQLKTSLGNSEAATIIGAQLARLDAQAQLEQATADRFPTVAIEATPAAQRAKFEGLTFNQFNGEGTEGSFWVAATLEGRKVNLIYNAASELPFGWGERQAGAGGPWFVQVPSKEKRSMTPDEVAGMKLTFDREVAARLSRNEKPFGMLMPANWETVSLRMSSDAQRARVPTVVDGFTP